MMEEDPETVRAVAMKIKCMVCLINITTFGAHGVKILFAAFLAKSTNNYVRTVQWFAAPVQLMIAKII